MALAKQNRLRSSRDFSRVHQKGKRASTDHLAVRALMVEVLKSEAPKKAKVSQTTEGKRSVRQKPILKTDTQGVGGKSLALSSCFGISISKKVSKRAVVRNRIKRQIKAAIRVKLAEIAPGWQVAIVVRPSAVECGFADFLRELEYLLKKLKILG